MCMIGTRCRLLYKYNSSFLPLQLIQKLETFSKKNVVLRRITIPPKTGNQIDGEPTWTRSVHPTFNSFTSQPPLQGGIVTVD